MRGTLSLVVRKATCLLIALSAGLAAAAACIVGCGGGSSSSTPSSSAAFDQRRAFEDLKSQVAFGPRPAGSAANRRQARFLARRLRGLGARDVRIQRPHRNVVARIPGTEPGTIVIGAHHDTKSGIPGFVGANDGASGVAVALELARRLAPRVQGPSVEIALFDAEEAPGNSSFAARGDRGSRQFVRYARDGKQGSPRLADVRAMVLLDMVGDCDLRIPRESNSDAGLYGDVAAAGDARAFTGTDGAVDDDHIPFEDAGIPALDLIDFDYGPGPTPGAWWHTPKDRLDKVCPSSLGTVGRAVLGALPAIGSR